MSAGLNRGRIDAGDYTTYDSPSNYSFIESLLHDCFDNGGNPGARIYWEVLLEFNYGPHYTSLPSFTMSINKISREPQTGHDAHGGFKTNLIFSKGPSAPGIRSLAHKRIDAMDYLPQAARDAIRTAIDEFEPDPTMLPGECRADHVTPVGDESDWNKNPFVEFTDDGPRLHLWDSDSPGVAVHTSARKLDLDDDERTRLYVQGGGTPFTPVERVVIDGEEYERPTAVGLASEYLRDGFITGITGGTAYINTRDA